MALLFLASPAADPFSGEPQAAEPVEAATPAEPAPLAEPAQQSDAIDLDDESTWEDLTPEQKDKLRAERAERNYQRRLAAGPQPPPALETDEAAELREARGEHAREREDPTSAAESYDNAMRNAVIATGVIAGVAGLVAVILAVQAGKAVSECDADEAVLNGCRPAVDKTVNFALGSYVTGSIAGASAVGLIVTGSMLGAHRSRRSYLTLRPTGLLLRF